MRLIIGLGNPEDKYSGTRHNLGFEIVDEFARKLEARIQGSGYSWEDSKKFQSEILQLNHPLSPKSKALILVKPQTYMNKSGLAVASLANFYKVNPEDIVIIHDELDLVLGKIKIRLGGAAAGHHGVESIISSLGTDKFIRVRLGIGNLHSQSSERGGQSFNVEHFVLESFLPQEKSKVKSMKKLSIKALDILLEKGLEKAQNQFN